MWTWYTELRSGEELSYQEIKAWAELTNQYPHHWEVDVLRALDKMRWWVIQDD